MTSKVNIRGILYKGFLNISMRMEISNYFVKFILDGESIQKEKSEIKISSFNVFSNDKGMKKTLTKFVTNIFKIDTKLVPTLERYIDGFLGLASIKFIKDQILQRNVLKRFNKFPEVPQHLLLLKKKRKSLVIEEKSENNQNEIIEENESLIEDNSPLSNRKLVVPEIPQVLLRKKKQISSPKKIKKTFLRKVVKKSLSLDSMSSELTKEKKRKQFFVRKPLERSNSFFLLPNEEDEKYKKMYKNVFFIVVKEGKGINPPVQKKDKPLPENVVISRLKLKEMVEKSIKYDNIQKEHDKNELQQENSLLIQKNKLYKQFYVHYFLLSLKLKNKMNFKICDVMNDIDSRNFKSDSEIIQWIMENIVNPKPIKE